VTVVFFLLHGHSRVNKTAYCRERRDFYSGRDRVWIQSDYRDYDSYFDNEYLYFDVYYFDVYVIVRCIEREMDGKETGTGTVEDT
jgi:hypothetical protein